MVRVILFDRFLLLLRTLVILFGCFLLALLYRLHRRIPCAPAGNEGIPTEKKRADQRRGQYASPVIQYIKKQVLQYNLRLVIVIDPHGLSSP